MYSVIPFPEHEVASSTVATVVLFKYFVEALIGLRMGLSMGYLGGVLV